MFEDLRSAFREAVNNFKDEIGRDEVPETVDKLLLGMRNEVADAKVRIKELEDQMTRAVHESEREKKEAATCRRREKMARDIDDSETADVAAQYAEKHEERQTLLEHKAVALNDELAYRQKEVEEMLGKVKEAQAKRDSLTATAGRGGARDSIGAAGDLFSEMDRMAEKIGDESARGEAAASMDPLDLHVDVDEPPPRPVDVDYDARLEELKRRMGEE
jgi:phage shock protein A